jgi:hypothetical protein
MKTADATTPDRERGTLMMLVLVMLATAAALLCACNEIPQDARKPFAGAGETRSAAAALDSRVAHQDEYARIQDSKP